MDTADPKPRHSIAVVAERTGLSQDLLRIWERRYSAVTPARGANGQRLYSDADVARLRLLHATSRAGRPIGQLAAMSTPALSALAEEDAAARSTRLAGSVTAEPAHELEILNSAIAHAKELEPELLASELRRAAASLGVATFIDVVAAPLMHRIGDHWASGSLTIAQEHLATAVLRDLLVDMMRGFNNASSPERIVVATPAGERHEIGAAMVGASAAAAGWSVVYLGADLPAADIVAAARASSATVVAVSVVYAEKRERVADEIRRIREALPPDVRLAVGGAAARSLAPLLDGIGVDVGGIGELF